MPHQYGLQRLLPEDDIDDNEDSMEEQKSQDKWFNKHCLIANLLLASFVVGRSVASLASQASMGMTNVYILNSMRAAVQIILGFILTVIQQKSFRIPIRVTGYVAACAFMEVIFGSSLFMAASFMPVGNLEAVYRLAVILQTTAIDFVRRHVHWSAVVLAIVAIVGVMLVSQPWNTEGEHMQLSVVPCQYWQNLTSENGSSSILAHSHYSVKRENISSANDTDHSYYIDIAGLKKRIPFSPFYLGYGLTIVASTAVTADGYLAKHLLNIGDTSTMIFWLGIFEELFLLSTIMVLFSVFGSDVFTFPTEQYCIVFTQCYVICLGVVNVVFVYALIYFKFSTICISAVLVMVILYVFQKTILKPFHPGHANVLEIVGIAVIVCGQLFKILLEIFKS